MTFGMVTFTTVHVSNVHCLVKDLMAKGIYRLLSADWNSLLDYIVGTPAMYYDLVLAIVVQIMWLFSR